MTADERAGAVPPGSDPSALSALSTLSASVSHLGGLPALGDPPDTDWWPGQLPVHEVSVRSVQAAASAARLLARVRGRHTDVVADPVATVHAFNSQTQLRVDGRAPVSFAPLSGYFPTQDGWIRLHGNYPHHRAVLSRVLGSEDRDEVARTLADRSALEVEREVRAAGGIAAALRELDEWRAHPQGAAVAREELVAVLLESGPRAVPPSVGLPMKGIRVLDLTRVIAGPIGTRLLGALGADVLRLDPPGLPELLDQHLDTGFAKRTGTADLADAATRQRVEELLAAADVLVTGYRPGALAAFGLDGAAVGQRHPRLVTVEFCAWGWSGPWAQERGFDSIVQSAAGIGHAYGARDHHGVWRPGALPAQALDHATGCLVAAAAMTLLARRHEVGAGHARLSLARTAHWLTSAGAAVGRPAERGLPGTERREADSPHGRLGYVLPPLQVDGAPLDYPAAPNRYACADLAWAQPVGRT